jgi:hypothetical protein
MPLKVPTVADMVFDPEPAQRGAVVGKLSRLAYPANARTAWIGVSTRGCGRTSALRPIGATLWSATRAATAVALHGSGFFVICHAMYAVARARLSR